MSLIHTSMRQLRLTRWHTISCCPTSGARKIGIALGGSRLEIDPSLSHITDVFERPAVSVLLSAEDSGQELQKVGIVLVIVFIRIGEVPSLLAGLYWCPTSRFGHVEGFDITLESAVLVLLAIHNSGGLRPVQHSNTHDSIGWQRLAGPQENLANEEQTFLNQGTGIGLLQAQDRREISLHEVVDGTQGQRIPCGSIDRDLNVART